VIAHPVVLLVIEHRHQDVEVPERLAQRLLGRKPNAEVSARTPFREVVVERDRLSRHLVAQWLGDPAEESLSTSTRQGQESDVERDRRFHQFRTVLALTLERTPQRSRNRDAEERRRDVRPIVHVAREEPSLSLRSRATTNELYSVDVEQDRRGATIFAGLRE